MSNLGIKFKSSWVLFGNFIVLGVWSETNSEWEFPGRPNLSILNCIHWVRLTKTEATRIPEVLWYFSSWHLNHEAWLFSTEALLSAFLPDVLLLTVYVKINSESGCLTQRWTFLEPKPLLHLCSAPLGWSGFLSLSFHVCRVGRGLDRDFFISLD